MVFFVFLFVILYVFVKLVFESDLYLFVVLVSGCIVIVGVLSLVRVIRRKRVSL